MYSADAHVCREPGPLTWGVWDTGDFELCKRCLPVVTSAAHLSPSVSLQYSELSAQAANGKPRRQRKLVEGADVTLSLLSSLPDFTPQCKSKLADLRDATAAVAVSGAGPNSLRGRPAPSAPARPVPTVCEQTRSF